MATTIAPPVAACPSQDKFTSPLSLLVEVEKDLLALSAIPQARYIRLKRYLTQPVPAMRAVCRSLVGRPLIPAWKLQRLIRFAREWGRGNVEEVASTACLIEMRTHWRQNSVRSYYLPSNSTIKWAVPSADGSDRISREIWARQIVAELGALKTPTILGQRNAEECLAIHEEWVDARAFRRKSDIGMLGSLLLPQLKRHYEAYGIHEEPIERVLVDNFADRVAEGARHLPWPRHWVDKSTLLKTVERLEAARRTLSVSFCHNDLHGGNILIGNGGTPIVIDWEYAEETAIARDLAELYRCAAAFDRRLTQQSLDLLGQWASPTTYSPPEQLLLLALRWVASKSSSWAEKAPPRRVIGRLHTEMHNAQWLLRQHLL